MKSIARTALRFILYLVAIFYTFISLYPIVWMVFYSFKNNNEIFLINPFGIPRVFRIENYINAWNQYNIPRYFLNSTLVSAATITLTIFISLMFSYATARMKWKLANPARIYIMAGMYIPLQIIMIPLVILVRELNLSNSLWSLIIPYTAFELGFSSIVFYGYLRQIPRELEESALIDGASVYKCFFKIIVPLVRPAISTMVIFVFLYAWNEFTMALTLISNDKLKTLPLGLITFQGQFQTDWGGMGAAMVISSVPTILIYLLFNRQLESALMVGAVKG